MFLPYWVTALRTFFLATIAHLNSWFSKAWLHFFTLNLWGPEKPFTEERNGVSEHLQSYTVSKSVNAIWLTHEKRSLTWCKFHYYGENRRAETNLGFSAFHPGHSPPLTKLMEGGHIPGLLSEASQAYCRPSYINPCVSWQHPPEYWCKLLPWSPKSAMASSTLGSSAPRSGQGMGRFPGRFSEVGPSDSLWEAINSLWETYK